MQYKVNCANLTYMIPEDKIFVSALIISALLHGAVLLQHSGLQIFARSKNTKDTPVDVTYLKKALPNPKDEPIKRESFPKIPLKINAGKTLPPPFIDKENIFAKDKQAWAKGLPQAKPAFLRPDTAALKRTITLPPIGIDKINNPSYISYYQIVREKIRRCAYLNYTHTETGEVYLAFLLSNDGYLKNVQLVEEKSARNPYLREIASKSIRDASPFPAFPKELNYPQLSFNVVISFTLE